MPRVEVKTPYGSRWARNFNTPREAERYKRHMIDDRGYEAGICDREDVVPFDMSQIDWDERVRKYIIPVVIVPEHLIKFEEGISEHGKEDIRESAEE